MKQHETADQTERVTEEVNAPPRAPCERCKRQRKELRSLNRAMAIHKSNAEAWARQAADAYGVDRLKRYRELRFARMEEVRRRERAENDVRKLATEVRRLGGDPARILKKNP